MANRTSNRKIYAALAKIKSLSGVDQFAKISNRRMAMYSLANGDSSYATKWSASQNRARKKQRST